MGRNRSRERVEARRIAATQRLEAQSATNAQATPETVVPDLTEAPSRAQVQLQELPEHWKNPCKVPSACDYRDTPSDCFWLTPVMFAELQDDHATAA